jgi:hypothetical protein
VLAHGRCKALYEYSEKTCTRINDYAKKILRADRRPKPMNHGQIDWVNLAPESIAQELKDQTEKEEKCIEESQMLQSSNGALTSTKEFKMGANSKDRVPGEKQFAFKHTVLAEN